MAFAIDDGVHVGGDELLIVAGPCVIESEELCLEVAARLAETCTRLGVGFVFKASFDKANRTSGDAFRGPGSNAGLAILAEVKAQLGVPLCTDVHEVSQVEAAAEVCDILQVPAFLCRQTDLLRAAGASGRCVNLKKGQFMAPQQMIPAVEKVRQAGGQRVLLTERGSCFGHGDLVVDFRGFPRLRDEAPLLFDATHSAQAPGSAGDRSGGDVSHVPVLARAAAGAGVDGFFMETHPDPPRGLSDAATMLPLDEVEPLLRELLKLWSVSRG